MQQERNPAVASSTFVNCQSLAHKLTPSNDNVVRVNAKLAPENALPKSPNRPTSQSTASGRIARSHHKRGMTRRSPLQRADTNLPMARLKSTCQCARQTRAQVQEPRTADRRVPSQGMA